MRLAARLRQEESGFSLVELVISTAILSIILLAVGGLMYSTTVTQRTVSAVSNASSSAQTAADAIRTQIRNAAEFRRWDIGTKDQLVIARVAGSGSSATYTCRAWYFSADARELRTTTYPVAGSTTLPSGPSSVSTWQVLLTGVTPRSGSTLVFGAASGGTLPIGFLVAADDRNKPVEIKFTAAMSGTQGGGTTCWD